MIRDQYQYQLSNREKTQQPKGKSFWCRSCDGALVSEGSKCVRCSSRAAGNKAKPGKFLASE